MTVPTDLHSEVPAPGGRSNDDRTNDLDAARIWLESTAGHTMAARVEALQDFIHVLAAELDTEADLLRTGVGSAQVGIADGMARSADYLRDAAIDVGNVLHHR